VGAGDYASRPCVLGSAGLAWPNLHEARLREFLDQCCDVAFTPIRVNFVFLQYGILNFVYRPGLLDQGPNTSPDRVQAVVHFRLKIENDGLSVQIGGYLSSCRDHD